MQLKEILKEIEKDCIKLGKENQLTEYGQGQLDLIIIINKKVKPCTDKGTRTD